jgi:Protein of unknown function (DUF3800)
MKTVAFDESGNSGENLLDRTQPIYSLASVCVADERAEDLVTRLLSDRQAQELKFSRLRKTASGQKVILNALRADALFPPSRWILVSEKSWFLAGKVIDQLIEPLVPGGALYASGMHRLSADWLFFNAAEEIGAERWAGFLEAFVAAARSQGEEEAPALGELAERLKEVQGFEGTTTARILRPIPASINYLADQLSGQGAKDQLEPALTALVGHIEAWSERLGEPFRVVHDDSKVIEDWVGELMRWSDPSIEPVSVETDLATFKLPLLATSIEFATSETVPAIQLADVLAGASAWWLKDVARGGEDEFAGEIEETGLRADWTVGSLDFQRRALPAEAG